MKENRGKIYLSKTPLLLGLCALFTLIAGAIYTFSSRIQQHDMLQWQAQLSLILHNRSTVIQHWISDEIATVDTIASNPAVRLYLTELEQDNTAAPKLDDDPYQLTYLRNLLNTAALTNRYLSDSSLPTVNANIPGASPSGIVITNTKGLAVVTTSHMHELESAISELVLSQEQSTKRYTLFTNADRQSFIIFFSPIYTVQGDPLPENLAGYIIGVKHTDQLTSLLKEPSLASLTAEPLLMQQTNNQFYYLTPSSNTLQIYPKRNLASELAFHNQGTLVEAEDYKGQHVLAMSLPLDGTAWHLVYKLNKAEALRDFLFYSRCLWLVGLCSAFLTAFVTISLQKRTLQPKEKKYTRSLIETLQRQKDILELVLSNKPEAAYIVDDNNRCYFANPSALRSAGLPETNTIIDNPLHLLLGKELAEDYARYNINALKEKAMICHIRKVVADDSSSNKQNQVFQVKHIPIKLSNSDIPLPSNSVLILEQNITESVLNQERLSRTLDTVLETFISLMNDQDPQAALHSKRVSLLSASLAKIMNLSEIEIKTVMDAGRLGSVYKLFIPVEILNKKQKLTKKDLSAIQEAKAKSIQMLNKIEFSGPVAKTVEHSFEFFDGSGALGLRGESIILYGRIVAVATAVVSMLLSPRKYRNLRKLDEVCNILKCEENHQFDPNVVAAFTKYIQNENILENWEENASNTTKDKSKKEAQANS